MKQSFARIRNSASGSALLMTVAGFLDEQTPKKGMGNKYAKEYRWEQLWRYRSVAWVVAVPLLLVLTVVLVMPRATDVPIEFSRATEPFGRAGDGALEERERRGGAEERFAVVVDAGSTGSRVHIFKFLLVGGALDLQYDKFEQLRPGLSSYADDPPAAAASLKPLLDLALDTVPPALHKRTPVMVGATAGLRLLPDGKADVILAEVRSWLRAGYPFTFDDADVKILSGVDEGAFAWLTLNYLLGNLGKAEHGTVASIDLGGGSVQEAFAMTPEEANAAPDPSYVTTLKGGGRSYSVYVYSYLGYGLMAGRAAVLSESKDQHPCVPTGYQGEYEYGGKKYPMGGHSEGASHEKCSATVLSALKHAADCGAPKLQCTFNGAWGGNRVPDVFYVSSYFWDRATDAGLVEDADAIQQKLTPGHFADMARRACPSGLTELSAAFPKVQEALLPFFCLDLSYAHTLLTEGFDIPETATITLVKRVQYKTEQIEAAWPLGAAINMMG